MTDEERRQLIAANVKRIGDHVPILKQGLEAWNQWRSENESIRPDLSYADLSYADLSGANLSGANFFRANLSHADLSYATLSRAILLDARVDEAVFGNNEGLTETDKRYLIQHGAIFPQDIWLRRR